jgi:hypothetical protein
MPSDTETLLLAVISQIGVGKIFHTLAHDIGACSPKAARHRWDRFQKKLKGSKSTNTSPAKPSGVQKSVASPTRAGAKNHRQVKEEIVEEEEHQTSSPSPVRRLPHRKARVVSSVPDDEPLIFGNAGKKY